VPLHSLQAAILGTLAEHRSPDSYIAGGAALGNDIDIFHDDEHRLAEIAENDARALRDAGFSVEWLASHGAGVRRAKVDRSGESTIVEWVTDADFRFFPAKTDKLFGYVLHPVDLATNKAAAAAGRREPRDIIDLVTIHEHILPLGAVLAATVGRFPGPSPEEILAEISRHSWLTPSDIAALSTRMPIDPADMHRRIRAMLEDAEAFLKQLPSDAVGFVFLRDGHPVQPDPKRLGDYAKHAGSRRGSWPSSPEIGNAMLAHVTKRD
jgi:hypothetical protein